MTKQLQQLLEADHEISGLSTKNLNFYFDNMPILSMFTIDLIEQFNMAYIRTQ